MKFSIVVPSFNQAQYLEDCLDSILMQRGVQKEIIVMDGGSTDGSVDIIRRYEPHLAYWQSQPDGGQSAALNAGFARATGEMIGWLCSDDFLLPEALLAVVQVRIDSPAVYYSNALHQYYPAGEAWLRKEGVDRHLRLPYYNPIDQPGSFWDFSLMDRVGPLDEAMHYAFDWDWYYRALSLGIPFVHIDRVTAVFRYHGANKTTSGSEGQKRDMSSILSRSLGDHAVQYVNACRDHPARPYRTLSIGRKVGRFFEEESVFAKASKPHRYQLTEEQAILLRRNLVNPLR